MVIKAQSPAGFAEEYIIESIWNSRFPPGSILPAERELSELIGVTRTTLREVLQRLARDGWLTIQHGKPTKVNNFWETSGLNILETLARLDHESVPQLIDNLLSVRTNISTIFIRTAFRQHPEDALKVLATAREVEDHADAFANLDYNIFRGLAFASGNPIYGLILNGMKGFIPALVATTSPARRHVASRSVFIIGWQRSASMPSTTRFMNWFVATVMTAGRSGTRCRKPCLAISHYKAASDKNPSW